MKRTRPLVSPFALTILLSVVLTPAIAQRNTRSLAGEYICESDPCTGITFNIERNKRGKYRVWTGSKGAGPDNYFSSDATNLVINDRTGSISFTYENGECSFKGVVKNRRIVGDNTCVEDGQRKNEKYTLVWLR